MATTTPQYNNMRPSTLKHYQQRPPHQHFIRSTQTQAYRPPPQRFFASHHPPSLPTRPQCQLCCKFGHVVMKYYHRFDIAFQGPSLQPSSSAFANSEKNSPSMHAMLASGTTSKDWFFDTGATHHLAKDHTSLSNVHPIWALIRLPLEMDTLFPLLIMVRSSFPIPLINSFCKKFFIFLNYPLFSSVFLNSALIIMSFLSFTMITFL